MIKIFTDSVFNKWLPYRCGPGSVVGIATGYGAGRSGDRIPVGKTFSKPIQTGPGAHPASCIMNTGSFPWVKSGRGVTLTPHPFYCCGHGRVELYLYYPCGQHGLYRASVPVQGWTLPYLPYRRNHHIFFHNHCTFSNFIRQYFVIQSARSAKNDREKFSFSLPIKPVVCSPSSLSTALFSYPLFLSSASMRVLPYPSRGALFSSSLVSIRCLLSSNFGCFNPKNQVPILFCDRLRLQRQPCLLERFLYYPQQEQTFQIG
jgi:hypothetical protein